MATTTSYDTSFKTRAALASEASGQRGQL